MVEIMRHLAEETIHAWLDGATGAEESRELETHIATCEACAAMVAEARGLVAGASRILTGLDHVPGDVIPRGAPAATIPAVGSPDARRSRVRWWTRSAALRAAAVLLILGGGTAIVLERSPGDGAQFLELQQDAAPVAESNRIPESSARAADDGKGAGSAVGAVGDLSASSSTTSPAETAEQAKVGEPGSDASVTAQRAERAATAIIEQERAAGAQAGGVGRANVEAAGAPRAGALTGGTPTAGAPVVAAPPPAVDSAVMSYGRERSLVAQDTAVEQRRVMADSVSRRRAAERQSLVGVAAPSPARLSAERRIGDSLAANRLSEIVITSAPVTAGVDLAGCYSIAMAPWIPAGERGARSPALPAVLTLEGRMLEMAADGPRMPLRLIGDTAEASRDGSYWRIAGRDSLVLVWRATQPPTTIRLGGGGPTRTGVAEQDGRRASVTAERLGDECIVERTPQQPGDRR
jgi:hypothetical protein